LILAAENGKVDIVKYFLERIALDEEEMFLEDSNESCLYEKNKVRLESL